MLRVVHKTLSSKLQVVRIFFKTKSTTEALQVLKE